MLSCTDECVRLIEQAFEAGCPILISTDPPPRLAALPMVHGDGERGWRRMLFRYGSLFVYGAGMSAPKRSLSGNEVSHPLVWCRFIQGGWALEQPATVTLLADPVSGESMPWECRFTNLEAFAPHLQPHLPSRINADGASRIIRYLAALFFGGADGKLVELPLRDWSMVPGVARPPTRDPQDGNRR